MDYFNDIWIGYLTAIFVKKCMDLSVERCPGCHSKLESPLLHQHYQHSLLDKLKVYFDEVRGIMIPIIDSLYKTIENSLPHSPDKAFDKECYCRNAMIFLINSHPDSLYWGRYITGETDTIIHQILTSNLKKTNKLSNNKNLDLKEKVLR